MQFEAFLWNIGRVNILYIMCYLFVFLQVIPNSLVVNQVYPDQDYLSAAFEDGVTDPFPELALQSGQYHLVRCAYSGTWPPYGRKLLLQR